MTIKGCESDDIYINRLFTINDFEYNNEKLLKDQIFWLESTTFNIPDSNEEFYAQCTIIKDSDINVEGYIYNYSSEKIFENIAKKSHPLFVYRVGAGFTA